MDLVVLETEELEEFIAGLLEDRYRVVGVREQKDISGIPSDKGFFTYTELRAPAECTLSFDMTQIPPKKYLQPAREHLFSFDLSTKKAGQELEPDDEKLVLFGVHPYDIMAITQMDKVFSTAPEDYHYTKRRQNTFIIGVDPARVAPRAFWSTMGAHITSSGFDLMLTDIGQCYVVEIGSQKGMVLLKNLKFRLATSAENRERDRVRQELKKRCDANGLTFPFRDLPALLEDKEDHVVWEEKARLCFSCGTCNIVCPTCYCFDIRDEVTVDLKKGARYRTWDGCLLSDFAKVAGGGNFRSHRTDRYRHRFYRKGRFIFQRFGDIACVGCGRCSVQCPSDIADPVGVFNRLKEEI